MYNSLGTLLEGVAESVRAVKAMTTSLMSPEEASEMSAYFDYLTAELL